MEEASNDVPAKLRTKDAPFKEPGGRENVCTGMSRGHSALYYSLQQASMIVQMCRHVGGKPSNDGTS